MTDILWLGAAGADQVDAVGGKAARLSSLVGQGLPVPTGFAVTTDAYARFFALNDLDSKSAAAERAADLDKAADALRDAIIAGALPDEIAAQIRRAYAVLGEDCAVAVRSSGTAEDLADASFAGIYATELNIRGIDALLDAVRRCWASMWTAGAIKYRRDLGAEGPPPRIAVLVQEMIPADVAGVAFIGNPLTARADEIVVNASWGLGESVVSGAVEPDEFVLDLDSLKVKHRRQGAKETRIDGTREGSGVEAASGSPDGYCLSDAQLRELGELSRKVSRMAGGLPQDIEWAISGDTLSLLQARPVTGVAFTWNEDLDRWQSAPEDDQAIWTRAFADEFWNGGVTPLFYSVRGQEADLAHRAAWRSWKVKGGDVIRRWKYFGGTIYYNSAIDETFVSQLYPTWLRPGALGYVHPSRRDQVLNAPFSWFPLLRAFLRVQFRQPRRSLGRWIGSSYALIAAQTEAARGPGSEALQALSDDQLKRQTDRQIEVFVEALDLQLTGNYLYLLPALTLLGLVMAKWYKGDNAFAMQDIISGLPKRNVIAEENTDLHEMVLALRQSPRLLALFEQHRGADFLRQLPASDEGRAFLARYEAFQARYGHRGHQDRDIYFARRSEDVMINDRALRLLLTVGGGEHPHLVEERLVARREQATREVEERIRDLPWGRLKLATFRRLLSTIHEHLILREDTRDHSDRITMSKKRCLAEIGRRLVERGVLERERDYFFLSKQELFDLLDGDDRIALARSKVRSRGDVFDRFLAQDAIPPLYLKGDRPLAEPSGDAAGDGLSGTPINRGSYSGPARVVPSLDQIGRIVEGDILVCTATDPGWSPVFLVIKGLVMETGGLLSHGSSLAREYGIPAIALPGAMKLIEDGATITVDGDAGTITIVPAGAAVAGGQETLSATP